MILPASPLATACGLITQVVQLVKKAGGFMFPEKKKSVSLFQLGPESLPWTAFLVLSVPKIALREFGALYLAWRELVGPINYLHFSTALEATSSMPVTTSPWMKLDKSL